MTPDKVEEILTRFDAELFNDDGWNMRMYQETKDWLRTTLTQYHQDITDEAMAREKQLKQIHTIELDTVSCMSIEQFVVWRDQRKQRPTYQIIK